MPRIKLTKKIIAQTRKEIVLLLSAEGFTDKEVGEIMNGMNRATIFRIRKEAEEEQTHKKAQ